MNKKLQKYNCMMQKKKIGGRGKYTRYCKYVLQKCKTFIFAKPQRLTDAHLITLLGIIVLTIIATIAILQDLWVVRNRWDSMQKAVKPRSSHDEKQNNHS